MEDMEHSVAGWELALHVIYLHRLTQFLFLARTNARAACIALDQKKRVFFPSFSLTYII